MANLLDLVDQLIGDVLAGNLYNNIDTYVNALRSPLQSPTGITHPHENSNVIPPPPHGPPPMIRAQIYQNGIDKLSIPEQTDATRAISSFAKGQSYSASRRIDRYSQDFVDSERINVFGASLSNSKQLISNIGGTADSKPSLGDNNAIQGSPPASSLKFQGPSFGDVPDLATIQGNVSQGLSLTPSETISTSLLQQVNKGSQRKDFAPIEGQINLEQQAAHRLGNQYDDKGVNFFNRGGTYSVPSYGLLRTLDIAVMAHWLRNVSRQVFFAPSDNNDWQTRDKSRGVPSETIVKSATWLASQFLLASLNKGDVTAHGVSNMVWNPLSLPLSMLPGLRGLSIAGITPTGITAHATGLFGTYKDNVRAASILGIDRLQLIRDGAYSEVAPVHRLSQLRSPVATPGFYGDLAKAGESDTLQQENIPGIQGVSVAAQVDGGLLTLLASKLGYHTNLYTSERPYAGTKQGQDNALYTQENARLDSLDGLDPGSEKLKTLFNAKGFPGGATIDFGPTAYTFVNRMSEIVVGFDGNELADAPGLNAAITDAAFTAMGEDPDTALVSENPIPEDDIYMPFMFQDLRDSAAGGPEQFLYFRAFLKNDLTETFVPDWQTERYYGRTEEIPTYLGTSRNINLSFDVVAWSPKDLNVVWTKLQKLQSMVYPTYNQSGFMNSGPIIRMRVGDLIAGEGNKGLSGYITALDFAYDDGIWNIQSDFKVPRKISVSLSFTALHDGNPGIYPYASAEITADGTVTATGTSTFGAGKFKRNDDGSYSVAVSVRDIRKIFGSVRNVSK